jgi:hypothetical protein
VSGYERVGQSTPKYMATGERQSVGFPVDSGFATARQSREAIKQETYLQFKQFIYTTRIPQRCHQFCNGPGIY